MNIRAKLKFLICSLVVNTWQKSCTAMHNHSLHGSALTGTHYALHSSVQLSLPLHELLLLFGKPQCSTCYLLLYIYTMLFKDIEVQEISVTQK